MIRRGRGKRVLLIVAGVLVIGGAIAWRVLRIGDLARIGAGYSAEQTCACLLVSGRTLDSCMTDLEPLARKMIKVVPGDGEVTANAWVAHATARYQKGFGCSLEN